VAAAPASRAGALALDFALELELAFALANTPSLCATPTAARHGQKSS